MRNPDGDLGLLTATARTAAAGIVLLSLLTLAQNAAGLAVPWISGRLAGALVETGGAGPSALDLLFAALALALVLQGALAVANIRLGAKLQMTLTARLQVRIYGHLQTLPLRIFHARRTGSLLSLLGHDTSQVAGFIAVSLAPALPQMLTFLAALAMMLRIDGILGAAAGLSVPLFLLAGKILVRSVRPLSAELSQSHGRATAHAESHLGAMPIIKAFNRGPSSTSEYERRVRRVSELGQRVAGTLGRIQPGLNLAAGLLAVGFVWLLSRRLSAGGLGAGDLVSFLMYGYFLARPMSQLAAVYGQLQHARASAARIREVLDSTPEHTGAPGRPLDTVRGEIEFHRVSFAYPGRPATLTEVDLHIRPGESVGLVGENGAGKTTLVHLLMRFAEPDAGEIRLDGTPLRSIDLRSLREHIGLVPQSMLLIDGTVAENIAFGRAGASRAEIEAAARSAQAHHFIQRLPQGYETHIGERGVRLSGGQQQRLALARALLADPPILIFDEATQHLDPESEARFFRAISRVLEQRTVILISHHASALSLADRIVHMKNGRIVQDAAGCIRSPYRRRLD